MSNTIRSEDEPLIEQYLAEFHAALPAATPLDKDRARRAEIAAHAVATLAMLVQLGVAAAPAS
jgi:hypothetical protein